MSNIKNQYLQQNSAVPTPSCRDINSGLTQSVSHPIKSPAPLLHWRLEISYVLTMESHPHSEFPLFNHHPWFRNDKEQLQREPKITATNYLSKPLSGSTKRYLFMNTRNHLLNWLFMHLKLMIKEVPDWSLFNESKKGLSCKTEKGNSKQDEVIFLSRATIQR